MSKHIHKQHNVSLLLYHFVCPAKYRKKIFTESVEQSLKEVCAQIEVVYEIRFVEIGADQDHVHFLVQSVPMQSPKKIIQTIKRPPPGNFLVVNLKSQQCSGAANSGPVTTTSTRWESMAMRNPCDATFKTRAGITSNCSEKI